MALPVPSSSDSNSKGSNFFGPDWPFSDPNKPFNVFGQNGPPPSTLPGLLNKAQSKEMDQNSFKVSPPHEVNPIIEVSVPKNGTSSDGGVISGGGAAGFAPLGPILATSVCITGICG